jgi:site-specific DNA recombinase
MKTAYLYVRVSTDEQKRQGYSLIEQEERLLKHCEINNIKITGIFREDCSAKDSIDLNGNSLLKRLRKIKADLVTIFYFLNGTDIAEVLNLHVK